MPQNAIPHAVLAWRRNADPRQVRAARKLAGLAAQARFDYMMGATPGSYLAERNAQIVRCDGLGIAPNVLAEICGLSGQKVRDVLREYQQIVPAVRAAFKRVAVDAA